MDITISMSPEEQTAFLQLLDAAVKHLGLNAVDAVAHFKGKIASAQSNVVTRDGRRESGENIDAAPVTPAC
jgi:hypothetical protein